MFNALIIRLFTTDKQCTNYKLHLQLPTAKWIYKHWISHCFRQ